MILAAGNLNNLSQVVDFSRLCQLILHRVPITLVKLFLLCQLLLNLPEVIDAEFTFADVAPAVDMADRSQGQTMIHTAGHLGDLQTGERLNLDWPTECLFVCLLIAFAASGNELPNAWVIAALAKVRLAPDEDCAFLGYRQRVVICTRHVYHL